MDNPIAALRHALAVLLKHGGKDAVPAARAIETWLIDGGDFAQALGMAPGWHSAMRQRERDRAIGELARHHFAHLTGRPLARAVAAAGNTTRRGHGRGTKPPGTARTAATGCCMTWLCTAGCRAKATCGDCLPLAHLGSANEPTRPPYRQPERRTPDGRHRPNSSQYHRAPDPAEIEIPRIDPHPALAAALDLHDLLQFGAGLRRVETATYLRADA